jgi:aspartate aminotransferase
MATPYSLPLSDRVRALSPSATVAATARAAELRQRGVDLLSMTAGEPDFDTPENIRKAAARAIETGKTRYSLPASGIPELKDAICAKLRKDNELEYDRTDIIVTCGAKQTIFDAVVAVINEGDEAVIPAPYWVSYAEQVRLMGGRPIIVETHPENGYRMTAEELETALSPRTRVVFINSPCNPTGEVYTPDELAALADVLVDRDLVVISDEIYEKILYDDAEHVSIASLHPALRDRTLVVNGVSKAYAMTGWRVGYGAGPTDLIAAMIKVQTQETTNTCTISQHAALEALTGPQESVSIMRRAFQHRRDRMVERLNAMPFLTCRNPRGAFYVFPDVSELFGASANGKTLQTDLDVVEFLMESALVAAVPGSGFGNGKHIRLSYAVSDNHVDLALERIGNALSALR